MPAATPALSDSVPELIGMLASWSQVSRDQPGQAPALRTRHQYDRISQLRQVGDRFVAVGREPDDVQTLVLVGLAARG